MHTPPDTALITLPDGRQRRWHSEAGRPPPSDIRPVDDQIRIADALRDLRAGKALLWQGDYPNARHFLQALARRVEREQAGNPGKRAKTPAEHFARHRELLGERARLLAGLIVPLDADYTVPLPRAQTVAAACRDVFGDPGEDRLLALRELLAIVSAHEWRKKGVLVPAIGGRIHPHYGVFSPIRGEYLDLLSAAPLPRDNTLAFDIGTGTGVIAALLAQRGIQRVIATDLAPRALACARENIDHLGLSERIELRQADLFPPGRAPLIVCNPPWIPAQPSAPIEYAVYDPDSSMLRGFLGGLREHLTPDGEGWLILSDIAEHLGLRQAGELQQWITAGGLAVVERHDIRPHHPKTRQTDDPLHSARANEVTSLWRLSALT